MVFEIGVVVTVYMLSHFKIKHIPAIKEHVTAAKALCARGCKVDSTSAIEHLHACQTSSIHVL